MKKKYSKPVPVLMYHSIGIPNKKWQWSYLTCPWQLFEDQLKSLYNHGYKSINLSQLYDYIFNSIQIPKKSIVFTFDDGYLDNWVFAYPLMKKYGFHGTIFINPEFIDERGGKRKFFIENTDNSDLETVGFLTWDEIKEMENEGVMSIESHALTHTWYPKSDKIIDFRHPNDKYIWMTWNNNFDVKYKLQYDNESLVHFGEPVYEFEKSLSGKRFFPDENLNAHISEFVINNGGKSFFSNEMQWKNKLFEEVKKYKLNHVLVERYETDVEYRNRITHELKSTKSIIESKLGKEVKFHCWPGGSATKTGMNILNDLGFKLSNAADDILEIRYKIKNNNQLQSNRLNRFAPIVYFEKKGDSTFHIRYSSGKLLLMQINAFASNGMYQLFNKLILRFIKIIIQKKKSSI